MDDRPSSSRYRSSVELELYFLIERFLSAGPCKSASKVLRRELDEHGLLPKRIDWRGGEHERSFESLLELNRHIGGYHLLKICQRMGPLLDEQLRPRIAGVASLLGAGSQSLLRTEADMEKMRWAPQAHLAVLHGQTPVPPINLVPPNRLHVMRGREMTGHGRHRHVLPSCMFDMIKRHTRRLGHLSSVYCVLFDRSGSYIITGADDQLVKIWIAADGRLKATLRGHSAEITDMAVNFENTLLASGSCDKTIRMWCLKTGAPVAVLQGHTGMVTSLQFSPFVRNGDIRYLASTGGDACVCFWEWNVTNNKFNPKPCKYIERSRAGAMILCSSFSPGGMFFAAGSTDHVIRMYHFHSGVPEKIGELEKHTDRVDTITYAHRDNRFLSGSRDGTARIWRFERNEWRNIALESKIKLKKEKHATLDDPTASMPAGVEEGEDWMLSQESQKPETQKLRVTMVGWTIDDTLVITAVNDHSLKVWCSTTGALKHVLKGHNDEVFVLEPNPVDPHILLSAGHDGNIIIWDVKTGTRVNTYFNSIEGQGHGAVFDCKFNQSGTGFAATDSHGHLIIYGFGCYQSKKPIPEQLFFHTDYRPLIRDSNNYVLDEQTQQAPHLMPPPFLVDIDGNPYPPALQRLVPGRENCREDLLIPQLAVNEDGAHEVIGEQEVSGEEDGGGAESAAEGGGPGSADEAAPAPSAAAVAEGEVAVAVRPSIDQMIQELQRQQDRRLIASGEAPINSPPQAGSGSGAQAGPAAATTPGSAGQPPTPQLGSPMAVSRSNSVAAPSSSHMVGMRRVGETEGVRQSLGNIQQVSSTKDLTALSRGAIVCPLRSTHLRQSETERLDLAEQELRMYNVERKKKNPVARRSGDGGDEPCPSGIQTRKKKVGGSSKKGRGAGARAGAAESDETATNRLTARALYDTDEEEADESMDLDAWNEDEYQGGDNADSSEYSDWCVDTSSNLQPPKRTSTRTRKRKRYSSFDDEEEEEETEEEADTDDLADDRDEDELCQDSGDSRKSRGKRSRGKHKQEKKKKKAGKMGKHAPGLELPVALPVLSPASLQDLLTTWRAPDWLTDAVPRKQPYFPQMGDELVYFRQGHELYVRAVHRRNAYPIDPGKNQAWHKYPSLRELELVRIVGVRYELLKNGVRLCCLKLGYIDPVTLKNAGGSFSIKYHDMPDVVDFLVLKQNYDIAMTRNWKIGDRFMSLIDDSWWFGIIESQIPFQEEYPDSMFQSFKVRWDNAEREHLSPWDLEPVTETKRKASEEAFQGEPSVIGGGVMVTDAELKALLYKPKPTEWQGQQQGQECDRILGGIEKVMEHSIAEPFLTPVDLNAFPSYAMSIEYPMDLNTIKRRLEHRFYRRVTALQFDLRYIEANAKKFNEPKSQIVRSAQVLCDSLLNFISDHSCEDPCSIINSLTRGRKIHLGADGSDSGDETEDYDSPSDKKHGKKETSPSQSRPIKKRRLNQVELDPEGWRTECKQLLHTILQCEDSIPFREPVDRIEYPKYYEVIKNPIALTDIRDRLEHKSYANPTELAKHMKLMFSNSRSYNTNKRSKIYSMTLRLSAMYESRMKEIIVTWNKALHQRRKKYQNMCMAPKSHSDAGPSDQPGPSKIASRPFASVSGAGASLTNGRSLHSPEENVDVDVVGVKSQRSKPRPFRERRMVRPARYTDSDPDVQGFPEPKPDYRDDDFELPSEKRSPKKKGLMRKQSGLVSNGRNADGTRYSTRAATGSIKARKYTNAGYFTDEEDDELIPPNPGEHHEPSDDDDDSDTELEEVEEIIIPVKKVHRGSRRHASKSKHRHHGKVGGRPGGSVKRKHVALESGPEDEDDDSDSDTESNTGSSSSSSSCSSKSSDSSSSGDSSSDTEPTGPVVHRHSHHKSQGSHSAKYTKHSSGKLLHRKGSQKSSYASSATSAAAARRNLRTRNQGRPRITYHEDDSDNSDSGGTSVSMRGRVRKPTAIARGIFD